MSADYVKKVRELCDEKEIILIFDEVQTGMGRTGEYFAHNLYGIEPDIFTFAKALGGGIPIGGFAAKDFVASAFSPGDHGTTFGGNPFATAAGLAVFDIIEKENILENVKNVSKYFVGGLLQLKQKYPEKIKDIRNAGLLIGIEFDGGISKNVFNMLFENKFLTSLCTNTIRIAPPLILKNEEADLFISALDKILK